MRLSEFHMADFEARFNLSGARQLERALLELGPKPAGRAGTNAVRAGARIFARKMRENIQARGLVKTGAMLRSVRVRDDRELSRLGGSERAAYAGSELFYAKFSEFGTSKQPAQPWARPAVDEGAQEA